MTNLTDTNNHTVYHGGVVNYGDREMSECERCEFDKGMRDAMKEIALSCGRKFAIDVGYDDLPGVVNSIINQEKTKRTKVEYVKWNFECAWHAIKAFEDGEKLYTKRSHKDFVLIDNAPGVLRFLYDLHERIETEIDWRDEVKKLDESAIFHGDGDLFTIIDSNCDNFVKMCHLVAELTGKPEGE